MWLVYRRQIESLFGAHLNAREAEEMARIFDRIVSSLRSKPKEKAA
jgi:hypothetical protein